MSATFPYGAEFRLKLGPQGDVLYRFTGRRSYDYLPIEFPDTVVYEIKDGELSQIDEHDHPINGNAWLSPDGDLLFTRGGAVLRSEDFSLQATILGDDSIKEIQFSENASFAVITLESGQVLKASGDSYRDVEPLDGIEDAYRAYPHAGEVRVLTRTEMATLLVQ